MPFADYESFESCTRDNSDKADPEAYCAEIKRQVEGEQSLSEAEIEALDRSDCPEGHVKVNDQCMKYTEVENVPQSIMNEDLSSVFQLASLESEPIEREELGESKVAYRNLKILQSGIWKDSTSREAVWYSPGGLENMELASNSKVNINHDDGNEVSEIGEIETLHAEDGALYADVEIDTSNAAGEYADKNLQKTLETEGAKGFGGPSVEIPPEGQEMEYNDTKGVRELTKGKIDGLALVANPASKPTSFARQTAQRGVALSSDQSVMQHNEEIGYMNPEDKARILSEFSAKDLQGPEEVQEEAQSIADTLDVPIGDVMEVLDPLFDMDGEEEGDEEGEDVENQEDEDEEGEEENEGDGEEEEGDDVDIDMDDLANKVESMDERLQNLEDMMEQAMQAEDLEEAKEELADAETVAELAEAKEELEKRLSELEDTPLKSRSLSEDASEGDTPENISFSGEYDSRRNAYSR